MKKTLATTMVLLGVFAFAGCASGTAAEPTESASPSETAVATPTREPIPTITEEYVPTDKSEEDVVYGQMKGSVYVVLVNQGSFVPPYVIDEIIAKAAPDVSSTGSLYISGYYVPEATDDQAGFQPVDLFETATQIEESLYPYDFTYDSESEKIILTYDQIQEVI